MIYTKHTLIFHTIGLARKIQKIIGFKSSPLSLSYSEAAALLIISDLQKDISQIEIASRLHLEPASIVSLIDKLEKLGLVKRVAPDVDRRKYHIVLTPEGEIKAKQIKNKTYELDNFLRKKISKGEIQTFYLVLEKLTAYLDEWKGGENEIPSTKRHLAS